jgi:hypothetical protein
LRQRDHDTLSMMAAAVATGAVEVVAAELFTTLSSLEIWNLQDCNKIAQSYVQAYQEGHFDFSIFWRKNDFGDDASTADHGEDDAAHLEGRRYIGF